MTIEYWVSGQPYVGLRSLGADNSGRGDGVLDIHNTQDKRRLRRPLHPLVLLAYSGATMATMKEFEIRIRNGGDDAIAAVAELWESREKILFGITDAFTKAWWVQASERLPDENQNVLVFDPECHGTHIALCHKDSTGAIVWASQVYYGLEPTHWMPLPEPPEVADASPGRSGA